MPAKDPKSTLHIPVLLKETLEVLAPKASGLYLDGTVGLGGHSQAILEKAPCTLLALDRDSSALAKASERLAPFGSRVELAKATFANFAKAYPKLTQNSLDGVLLDLGVSSMQLDFAERGFSFRLDGPLDMRMDATSTGPSAAEIVNTTDPEYLREILATLGEEPQAARIVRGIVAARQKKPLTTTLELAQVVLASYPKAWLAKARHHPATKTFQALRLLVNDELGELKRFLDEILPYLRPGGRLVIITFHSLEDRLVKQSFQNWAKGCLCPPYVSHCTCGHHPEVHIITKKPLTASQAELEENPRASSAKLRACEKLPEK